VRDAKSQDILSQNHIGASLIEDFVFTYKPKTSSSSHNKTVGISIRNGYIQDEQFFIKMVEYLKKKGYSCVFLSQSLHPTDSIANDEQFAKKLFPEGHITHTLAQTLDWYPKLDFVVGMRLHALILSFVHGVPFLALSYSKKTDEFLKIVEYPHSLSCQELDIADFYRQFEDLEQDAERIKFAFGEKSLKIDARILHSLNSLFHGVEKSFR